MNKSIRRIVLLIIPILLLGMVGYRVINLINQEVNVTVVERPVRVQTLTMTPQPLTVWIYSEGTAQAQRKAFLDFEVSGKVEGIGTQSDGTELREGSRVFGPINGGSNGQLLAQIDNRDNLAVVQGLEARLKSMQAQRNEAKARLQQAFNDQQLAAQNYQRMKGVFERGVISKEEFDHVSTTQLNANAAVKMAQSTLESVSSEIVSLEAEFKRATLSLEKTSLFAPFDGIITAMNIREDNHYYPPVGSASDRERESNSAIVIVDDSRMEIQLEIGRTDAAKLKEGQVVYLSSDDHKLYTAAAQGLSPQDVAVGQIWSVSPSLSLQRRSQTVKVRVEQINNRLKEGQFVHAWIVAEQIPQTLVLPLHALSFKHGKPFVFVLDGTGQRVSHRGVTLGEQGTDVVAVTSGLKANEKVVVRGQHLLVDGASVIKLETE